MTPPSTVPVQVVGEPLPSASAAAPLPPAQQPAATVTAVVAPPGPSPAPARVESCLECGIDLTHRPRVQSCPDCGSIFCSARCYREHRYHAHSTRR